MPVRGFFNETKLLSRKPLTLIPSCGPCGLRNNGCQSPLMPVSGQGERRVLLIGEAPAANEDAQGLQFVGKAGVLLEEALDGIGVDMRRDCWLTNSVICLPKADNGKWRNPTDKEVDHCRPTVITAIREKDPDVVITLGAKAIRSVIGWLWNDPEHGHGGMGRWAGWRIPCRKPNVWICPISHPSYIDRMMQEKGGKGELVKAQWIKELRRAFALKSKPWAEEPTPYEQRVRTFIDPDAAVPFIEAFTNCPQAVAWDYETDGAKPDSDQLEILTCGMSDGETSFAFPWHGNAIKATRAFLRSRTPKLAHNIDYEMRWSIAKLGVAPRNVRWDSMQAAHVLDCRRGGICSLEFQEFVWLGVTDHKRWIKPYMGAVDKTNPNNSRNSLRKVDLNKLLQYNAIDALVEWEVAQMQAAKFGVDLGA